MIWSDLHSTPYAGGTHVWAELIDGDGQPVRGEPAYIVASFGQAPDMAKIERDKKHVEARYLRDLNK